MSIFGERIGRPRPDMVGRGPDMAEVLSDYVTREYIDGQLALRVLKAGDTMTGDLTMARGRVRGLPTSKIGPRLQGDEAVSQFETVDITTEALKHFKAQLVSDLSEYAKKDYVDAQDALRVGPTYQNMPKKTTSMHRMPSGSAPTYQNMPKKTTSMRRTASAS